MFIEQFSEENRYLHKRFRSSKLMLNAAVQIMNIAGYHTERYQQKPSHQSAGQ
jgi:hypothetical protein